MRLLLLSTVVFLLFATPARCQDSHSPEFYIEQGYIAWHQAKYFEAIENYTRAIEIDEATLKAGQADAVTRTRLADTYLDRAMLFLVLKRDAEAEGDLMKYVQLGPNERPTIEDLISRAKANRK